MTLSSEPITAAIRSAVFLEWGDTCAYCRVRPAEEVDHIVPRAQSGPDAIENYAAACMTCNRMKSDMLLGEGLIGILQEKARRKAPAIRARLAPAGSTRGDALQAARRARRKQALDAYLAEVAIDSRDAGGDVDLEIAAHRESVEHKTRDALQAMTRERRQDRRRRALEAEREAAVMAYETAIAAHGTCRTAARLLALRDTQGKPVEKIRALTRRRSRPPAKCTADLGISLAALAELRDAIHAALPPGARIVRDRPREWLDDDVEIQAYPSTETREVEVTFGPDSHPDLQMQNKRGLFDAGTSSQNGQARFVTGMATHLPEGRVTFSAGPLLIRAIDVALALGTPRFTWTDPFGLGLAAVPPASHCRPLGHPTRAA